MRVKTKISSLSTNRISRDSNLLIRLVDKSQLVARSAGFFFEAMLCAIRLIDPELPVWRLHKRILEYVNVVTIDEFGNLGIHGMHPLNILREKGIQFFIRWLTRPILKWREFPCLTIVMYRGIKDYRAANIAGKCMMEYVSAHTKGLSPKT